jgi:hypothetical protein
MHIHPMAPRAHIASLANGNTYGRDHRSRQLSRRVRSRCARCARCRRGRSADVEQLAASQQRRPARSSSDLSWRASFTAATWPCYRTSVLVSRTSSLRLARGILGCMPSRRSRLKTTTGQACTPTIEVATDGPVSEMLPALFRPERIEEARHMFDG